jgi:multidrug efflux pump subunit AcrA (membrane-fusion protein)
MAAELDVNNAAGRLAPGMFAEVRWPARRTGESLFIPKTAVVATTERTFVIRIRDGAAEWVDVKRGAAMNDLIEVFGSLKAGDQVAVRGTDELRAGTRVRPTPQATK